MRTRHNGDREPLPQRLTAAACYAMVIAIAIVVVLVLQPITDDLGPGQGAVLTGLITPLTLAAINRRARKLACHPVRVPGSEQSHGPHRGGRRQPVAEPRP